jgi:DNA-binding response OmpR family regulator
MGRSFESQALVLLLEDEAVIAIDLQDELQDAGFQVAGPFTTCVAALEWLQSRTPQAAILDTLLKDGPCREIAIELERRRVPFVIYSGVQEDDQLAAEFPHVTWIEKPASPEILVQACTKLLNLTV